MSPAPSHFHLDLQSALTRVIRVEQAQVVSQVREVAQEVRILILTTTSTLPVVMVEQQVLQAVLAAAVVEERHQSSQLEQLQLLQK